MLDSHFKELIHHVIDGPNYERTRAVLLVASLTTPWNVIEQLEDMANLVMECCSHLEVSDRVRRTCLERGLSLNDCR